MQPFRVTLVEDEPSHATLIQYHLNQLGAEVTVHPSGSAFFQHRSQLSTCDLLIVSDQLVDLSIFSLLDIVKEQTKQPSVLILTTGRHELIESSEHNLSYLQKPFAISELRAAIDYHKPSMGVTMNV
ncbi:response regulator [Halalkalibacterium halodurans]|jgi:DNA-binding response OmpR family regulator|uniref:BH3024 protein n=2 Tax=Halalkalibacterium halodurans TaxID=86665 RepID=Q9K8I2_HALH5|nr:response regulator [Halalkalibacterium halodurans]MDY7223569.1 response regulator [Halalkalibacterium halodurans]MDY7242790.1 response regulator [Halalkalibacterium halodurans]MED3646589.1 response regulator [Halalkalibacterium halodurans]MED4082224.1 response regulator [Halalkalibacterium halodurans]MED4084531.1 response regulator [Halalkalibacterium halodurans]